MLLLNPFFQLFRWRFLIYQMTKREIQARYKSSFIGIVWAFVNPLLMLAVFTFVFSVVFQARWGERVEHQGEYALVLFAGLIMFWLFNDIIARAPGLIVSNPSFVKKVVFPIDILPWVTAGAAVFHFFLALLVLLIVHVLVLGLPPATALLVPLLMLPLVLLALGLSWLLAGLGVYFRDLSQIIGVLMTVLMFMSPIFYPLSAVPERFRALIFLNPVSYFIEESRQTLIWGHLPDAAVFGGVMLLSWVVACVGLHVFQRLRQGFADVI